MRRKSAGSPLCKSEFVYFSGKLRQDETIAENFNGKDDK
jgi:hypothetical protein